MAAVAGESVLTARHDAPLAGALTLVARAAGVLVAAGGAVVLAGWVLQIEQLKSVVPGLATMKANAALGFVGLGLGLALAAGEQDTRWRRRFRQVCGLLVACLGALTLGEYALGWDLGIDQLVWRDQVGNDDVSSPGRMAPESAFNLLLLGTALTLLGVRRTIFLVQCLALLAMFIAFLVALSYLYGVSSLYRIGPFNSVSLHSAAAFLVLGAGILTARPHCGLMSIVNNDTAEGVVARWLLPVALVTPVLLGWLRLAGQRAGWYDTEFGLAVYTSSNVVVLTAVILWCAVFLRRTDLQRLEAEADRRVNYERFRAVIENMTEGVVISDLDGQLLHWNRAALDFHGFTSSAEWCRRLPEFTEFFELRAPGGQILPLEEWPLSRLLRGERLNQYEVRVRRIGTDTQRIFSYGGEIVPGAAGKPVAFLTMFDVTERRLAEETLRRANEEVERRVAERTAELAAANKELEAFSYSISHDLRAPLRAIDGFSKILLADYLAALPAEAQEYLRDVRASTQQMGELVDDLLAFSRLSRQPIQRKSVSCQHLVQQCLDELRPEMAGRQVDVRIGELPPCSADPALLKQVWVNLLSNSIKYTGRQPAAVIEVAARNGDSTGQITYSVKDNGVGFDMRYAHKLFGVFQRLHRAEDYAGTGVGLAIVQRIVHRHGGRVWAESAPNQGATFYFTLAEGENAHV